MRFLALKRNCCFDFEMLFLLCYQEVGVSNDNPNRSACENRSPEVCNRSKQSFSSRHIRSQWKQRSSLGVEVAAEMFETN